jgi:hypothetical protein
MTIAARNIGLSYGANLVWLKPSLRAATILEKQHGGFPALLTQIEEQNTTTIRAVIMASAIDTGAAQRLLEALADQPLTTVTETTLAPCMTLVAALMMPEAADTTPARSTTNKPGMAWADLFAELYRVGTGWLGWTPGATWNATPSEILQGFDGHIAKLKAIHGAADDDDTSTSTSTSTQTVEQRQQNVEAGLDPDFDRAGLQALKARHT